MIKKTINKLKNNIQKVFNKKCASIAPEAPKQDKSITRIKQLKQQLEALTNGYDKSINGLMATYNKALYHYDKQYQTVLEAQKKFRNRMLKEDELKQIEKSLVPYQEDLQNAGNEIDKVKQWKKDDTLEIIASIETLKNEYIDALAEEVKEGAEALQAQKQKYLQRVSDMGEVYTEIADTEKVLKSHLQDNGFKYEKDTLKRTLELHTSDLQLNQLTITPEEVADAMKS